MAAWRFSPSSTFVLNKIVSSETDMGIPPLTVQSTRKGKEKTGAAGFNGSQDSMGCRVLQPWTDTVSSLLQFHEALLIFA
ncbi:Uncharacterised protein [Bacteroides xylanisolvens]|nr:Uncharacterised protein [Bacteroides xylanisolvens]